MYNENKVKIYQKLVMYGLILISSVIGFQIGYGAGEFFGLDEIKKGTDTTIEATEETHELTTTEVEAFLIAYYTKKDLGENRNRYEPLMTNAMFLQETHSEELPINQAYKGFIVNQVFEQATIYIDSGNLVALAEVEYRQTQLLEKDSFQGALIDTPQQETVKVSFSKQDDNYLVTNLERVLLTSTGYSSLSNRYQEIEYPDEFRSE